jgi:hypothetical protein
MSDILVSSPLMWLYAFYVLAMVLAILWPGRHTRPKDAARRRPEQRIHRPGPLRAGDASLPARRFDWDQGGRELSSVRGLRAACFAEYAARFSIAIKKIRKV